jgi:hypothetical protein
VARDRQSDHDDSPLDRSCASCIRPSTSPRLTWTPALIRQPLRSRSRPAQPRTHLSEMAPGDTTHHRPALRRDRAADRLVRRPVHRQVARGYKKLRGWIPGLVDASQCLLLFDARQLPALRAQGVDLLALVGLSGSRPAACESSRPVDRLTSYRVPDMTHVVQLFARSKRSQGDGARWRRTISGPSPVGADQAIYISREIRCLASRCEQIGGSPRGSRFVGVRSRIGTRPVS